MKVTPNAKNNKFIGIIDYNKSYWIKFAIKAPPLGGLANKELISYLSEIFYISKNDITIIKGMYSSKKVIKISNITSEDINKKINLLLKKTHEQSNQLPFI